MDCNIDNDIRRLTDRFMAGLTSRDEEARLADYFRTHDVAEDLRCYKEMFAWFDRGMPLDGQKDRRRTRLWARTAALAAAVAAALLALTIILWPDNGAQPSADGMTVEAADACRTTPDGDGKTLITTDTLAADTAETPETRHKPVPRKPRKNPYTLRPPRVYLAQTEADTAQAAADRLAAEKLQEVRISRERALNDIYNEYRRIAAQIDAYVAAMETYDDDDCY